jgi:hypothetical protein
MPEQYELSKKAATKSEGFFPASVFHAMVLTNSMQLIESSSWSRKTKEKSSISLVCKSSCYNLRKRGKIQIYWKN